MGESFQASKNDYLFENGRVKVKENILRACHFIGFKQTDPILCNICATQGFSVEISTANLKGNLKGYMIMYEMRASRCVLKNSIS